MSEHKSRMLALMAVRKRIAEMRVESGAVDALDTTRMDRSTDGDVAIPQVRAENDETGRERFFESVADTQLDRAVRGPMGLLHKHEVEPGGLGPIARASLKRKRDAGGVVNVEYGSEPVEARDVGALLMRGGSQRATASSGKLEHSGSSREPT